MLNLKKNALKYDLEGLLECFFNFSTVFFLSAVNWLKKSKADVLKTGIKFRRINLKCDYYKLPPSTRRKVGMTHQRGHWGLMDSTRESSQLEWWTTRGFVWVGLCVCVCQRAWCKWKVNICKCVNLHLILDIYNKNKLILNQIILSTCELKFEKKKLWQIIKQTSPWDQSSWMLSESEISEPRLIA